ncbi:MAG: helix-turn-helix domain-containing protein [bacterium]|nr:helix-turn-helix domain-containing protein [bacterium]
MSRLEESLHQFNFSKNEADIYLATLALAKPSVTEIAKKTGKNRTATYFHVKKLVEKRILKESRRGKLFLFTAVSPSELAEILDRSLLDFKSFIPQLEALKKITRETPVFEITESRWGYFKVYDEISSLPEGSIFKVIEGQVGISNELTLLGEDQWRTFFTRIVERKIKTLGLFTEESLAVPKNNMNKENLDLLNKRIWELKTLPESAIPIKNLALIYGNKIVFLFPETSLVITVQHKGMADFFSAMFDCLFNFAKPTEKTW